eukprot:scaffold75840_cov56-Phaeocystis_antarctica.AAC.2
MRLPPPNSPRAAVYTRHGPAECQTSLSTSGPCADTWAGLQRESAAHCVTGEPSSTTGVRSSATAAALPSAGHCRRGTLLLAGPLPLAGPPCAIAASSSTPIPTERRAISTDVGPMAARRAPRAKISPCGRLRGGTAGGVGSCGWLRGGEAEPRGLPPHRLTARFTGCKDTCRNSRV